MYTVKLIIFLASLSLMLILMPQYTDSQQIISEMIFLTNDVVDEIVHEFRISLTQYLAERIQPELIQEKLDSLDYNVESVDGERLENKFTAGVQELLDSKTKVLIDLKNKAETAEQSHVHVVKPAREPYFNMRDVGEVYDYNTTVKQVPTFSNSVPVNLTDSFVQVPTNVFAYKSEVLNQVTWGKKLDHQFITNYNQSNHTLLYQYFGDASTGKNTYFHDCSFRHIHFASYSTKCDD